MTMTELKINCARYVEMSYEDPALAHKLFDEDMLKHIDHPDITRMYDDMEKDF